MQYQISIFIEIGLGKGTEYYGYKRKIRQHYI